MRPLTVASLPDVSLLRHLVRPPGARFPVPASRGFRAGYGLKGDETYFMGGFVKARWESQGTCSGKSRCETSDLPKPSRVNT